MPPREPAVRLRITPAAGWQLAALVLLTAAAASGRGALTAAAFALGAAACVLLAFWCHEFAHALAARAYGLRVEAIEMRSLLSGATRRQATSRADADIVIILAGPAANLLLAAAGLVLSLTSAGLLGTALAVLNAIVFVHSLLAGPASDGWRALQVYRGRGTPGPPHPGPSPTTALSPGLGEVTDMPEPSA